MLLSVKKLSELAKEQILQESYEPACVIADLAKKYEIPSRVIYDWRCKKKAASVIGYFEKSPSDLIELSVNVASKKASGLTTAVLEYNNLAISIDGNIKSATLVQMLTTLEESC